LTSAFVGGASGRRLRKFIVLFVCPHQRLCLPASLECELRCMGSNRTRSIYLDLPCVKRTPSDSPLFPLEGARALTAVALGWKSASYSRASLLTLALYLRAHFSIYRWRLPLRETHRDINFAPFSSHLPLRLANYFRRGPACPLADSRAISIISPRDPRANRTASYHLAPISRIFNKRRESRREMISRRLFGIQSDWLRDSYSLPRTTYSIIIIASSEVEWRCWRSREITTASRI